MMRALMNKTSHLPLSTLFSFAARATLNSALRAQFENTLARISSSLPPSRSGAIASRALEPRLAASARRPLRLRGPRARSGVAACVVARRSVRSRACAMGPPRVSSRRLRPAWLLACALWSCFFASAARAPELVLDASLPPDANAPALVYDEGRDAPLALTTGDLDVSGGVPLVRAVVRVTNPIDAPLERLGVSEAYEAWYAHASADAAGAASVGSGAASSSAPSSVVTSGPGVDLASVRSSAHLRSSWVGRLRVAVDETLGVLELTAPLRRGEELLDATSCPTTYALRDALRNVTYRHVSARPDATTRGVAFVVFDADGVASAPTSVLIDVRPVNDPPTLDLNGLHRPGLGYEAVMGERERTLGVMLADADAHVGDADGDYVKRGKITYDGDASAPSWVPDSGPHAFPDGAEAERVELSADALRGTSVTGTWDASAATLWLEGVDTLGAYRNIFASARYVNEGSLETVPAAAFDKTLEQRTRRALLGLSPYTTELRFTGGKRSFVFEIEDTDGATATARSNVTVAEMSRRVGDPSRDASQASPDPCGGAGVRDVQNTLGTGDPETCVCDAHYAGERCEIHPCNYRGDLRTINNGQEVWEDTETGEPECICDFGFEGTKCETACSGRGAFDDAAGACVCDRGYAGAACERKCDGCDGAHARCFEDADGSLGCLCSDDYMGPNCTIPCPCAPAGFGFGTCATSNDTSLADVDRGVCVCEERMDASTNRAVPAYAGRDCSLPCPECVFGRGECVAPAGFEAGVGAALFAISSDATFASEAARLAAIASASVAGTCVCLRTENERNGTGYAGDDCALACAPCRNATGTCDATAGGNCTCAAGFSGSECQVSCGGRGSLAPRNTSATEAAPNEVFDVKSLFPGVATLGELVRAYVYSGSGTAGIAGGTSDAEGSEGNSADSSASASSAASIPELAFVDSDATAFYCACDAATESDFADTPEGPDAHRNALGGFGHVGPTCEVPCVPCVEGRGVCAYDAATDGGACACFADAPNDRKSASELLPGGEDETGFGFTGSDCSVACEPCYNGTCAFATGTCACFPGFADPACLIECGSAEYVAVPDLGGGDPTDGLSFGQEIVDVARGGTYVGSRGRVNATGAAPGEGLQGTTVTCECEYMWTGPLCSHACPYPYDAKRGVCAVKDPSDADYGVPWTAEVVCQPGWTGLPEESLRLPATNVGRGRNCSLPCAECVHGTCQDDGTCLCDYGYIWQGPLFEGSDVGVIEPVVPFPLLDDPMYLYEPEWHGCRAKHPCNGNGELFNATCGPGFGNQSFMDNLTRWETKDPERGGGWGCTGEIVNGTLCLDPVTGEDAPNLFAMAYARWDDFTSTFQRSEVDLHIFGQWGMIQGGYCAVTSDADLNQGQPLHGGYCKCDSIRNGRFKHPSASRLESGGYDYYFQGWAGADCSTPCEPCSANGLCDATTGKCACHAGWNGYRCLTPCEPCEHGTCQYDGTCLCEGTRRLAEGTYALRLTRDPFFLEKGAHEFEAQGERRSRYVHPVYMHTYDLEDYVWELEYECPNRAECAGRTADTHLPTRPNETYFRYTTPNVVEVLKVNDALAELQSYRDSLVTDVEGAPFTMEQDEICEETNDNYEVTKGACLKRMRDRVFGRTVAGCGAEWDSVRPWDCDDVVKSHFVRERNLELGNVEVRYLGLQQSTGAENVWFANNVNERQRLINTMTRGRFNRTTGAFQTIRDPDYYLVWIVHQLIHGVASGDGYAGWNCAVKCDACDPDHGTCQYDGTCECAEGWYGAACDRACDCYRHVAVKNALELRERAEDVLLESVDSHSGYPIQPHGTCQRDGTCRCYRDPDGTQWTGRDCFTKCKPCANGRCAYEDGSCACDEGWSGEDCSTPTFVECLPCDRDHGACVSDGSCKCDRFWTGLDCSVKCSPCKHGDCQMDGSCHCRPGWTTPDCSKKIPPGGAKVRSDFALGDEGWRSFRNGCAGADPERVVGNVPDLGGNPLVARGRGRCEDASAGGDGGIEWDGAGGYLYLTDRLPRDQSEDDVAYFRAPEKFLGDQLAEAYGGTLSYELYVAGGGDALRNAGETPLGDAHASEASRRARHAAKTRGSDGDPPPFDPNARDPVADAPDVILVGGRPRHGLERPPFEVWDKHSTFEWSRRNFPELALNLRWSRERIVFAVESYLDAPQVFLGVKAPRGKHYPPGRCQREHCSVNFNFDLDENAGWVNLKTIPKGFRWNAEDEGSKLRRFGASRASDSGSNAGPNGEFAFDAWVDAREGTRYVGAQNGTHPYNPFNSSGTRANAGRVAEDGGGEGRPIAFDPSGVAAYDAASFEAMSDPWASLYGRADAGETDFVWERGDGALNPANAPLELIGDGQVSERGAYAEGTHPGNGGYAGTRWAENWEGAEAGSRENARWIRRPYGSTGGGPGDPFAGGEEGESSRADWDLLPEVYAAIEANRRTRHGQPATFTDVAWCLASLTEILIRGDYYGEPRDAFGGGDAASSSGSSLPRFRSDPSSNPMGPGETVRLDHVAISAKDPTPEDPTRWLEEEHAAFMAYVDRYARDYSVQFLADYFAEYAEAIRMSICNGNGVFVDGNATRAECACESNWVGVECEIPCLACVRGTCALSDDSQSATCVCDPGFAGELCDTPCPPCVWNNTVGGSAAAQGACYTNATGGGACRCAPGFGGAYCQHECPPCEYESTHPAGFEVLGLTTGGATCDERAFLGAYPGSAALCACPEGISTGLTCEIPCPESTCGRGACRHTLSGRDYFDVLNEDARLITNDRARCDCDEGWVDVFCDKECPGGATHQHSPGNATCQGRGVCSADFGAQGGAKCTCSKGYSGVMCESSTNECGNGVLDPGEECDDGNALNLDGCGWTVVGGVRVECVVETNWVCEPVKRHACAENRAGCEEAGDANDARCVCADEPVAFVDGVEQHDISVCACPGPVVAGGCQPA